LILRRRGLASYSSVFVFLILAVSATFNGCALIKPEQPAAEGPAKPWEASEMTAALTQRNQQFRSLRALARVDYVGPNAKQNFQEAIVVQRPDRLRLETLTFLGAILIVTVNNQEMIGYQPREGVFVRGKASREAIARFTQIPLEPDEITTLLIGLPPVDTNAPWKQEGNTLLFSPNGRARDRVAFEIAQPAPSKWERLNSVGDVELAVSFLDYSQISAGLFASRMQIEAPLRKIKLEIRMQDPELNGPMTDDLFTQQKPPNVKEYPIEALAK
jgi:hypothetical protein